VAVETVLLTGATGFVGPHVVEALRPLVRIRALVRDLTRAAPLAAKGVELVQGTLETANRIPGLVDGVDAIVHLAAATRAASEQAFERANALGTGALLEAARAARPRTRFVYLSSLAAVGPARNGRPVTADDEPMPLTAYGRTKLAGERLVAQAAGPLEVAILRAPAVYGPGERDLYEFFVMAARGILPVPTGPARPLQMVHVTDLARALALCATGKPVRGVYHIAEPQAYLWEQVGRLVARAVGKRARVVRIPGAAIAAAGAVSEWVGKIRGQPAIFSRDKARELLAPGWLCETETAHRDFGFVAQIPLEQGLAETADWYRANGWL